ncbi:MAG: hypothetical protein ACJ788_00175 [Ktedonobacteraceae bacterium]
MKTHRMYRHQREETPNILVLKPGENDVPVEMFEGLRRGQVTLVFDPYKAPEQSGNDDHKLDAHLGAMQCIDSSVSPAI